LLYDKSVKKLEELGSYRLNPSLENIVAFFKKSGLKPNFRVIQVSGTNGKTSTAVFLASLFSSAGIKAGVYLSPHVYHYGERFAVNGSSLSPEEFGKYFHQFFQFYGPLIEKYNLTEFEILTSMAVWLFNMLNVEVGVFETGVGGRFDAVTALNAEAGVITGVSLDHTDILGKTIREIAFEKLYPFKGKTVYILDRFLKDEIALVAEELNVGLKLIKSSGFRAELQGEGTLVLSPVNFSLKLSGRKFAENAFLAARIIENFGVRGNLSVLKSVRLPARFQKIQLEKGICIIDGSHNPEAITELLKTFKSSFKESQFVVVCGFMKDKDYETMLSLIKSAGPVKIFLVPIKSAGDRSANLYGHANQNCIYEHYLETAVDKGLSYTGLVLVTGSLYLCGDFVSTFLPRIGPEKFGYNIDGSFKYFRNG